ncbi:UNVERIFIED_ORG: hypothetical protein B5F06_12520 [Lacrimispora saccharolytica]
MRTQVIGRIQSLYGVSPEYLWSSSPDSAVFRHTENGKWFVVLMRVSAEKLPRLRETGTGGTEFVNILNLKCEPELAAALAAGKRGIFPAYHMNKTHWISVCLNGSVSEEELDSLIELSFELTGV